MKDSRQKSIRRVLFILIVMTIAFIWIHSMVPRPMSVAESGQVVELLAPVFHALGIGDDLADHIVRKIAHFLEYAALGGEICLYGAVNAVFGETQFNRTAYSNSPAGRFDRVADAGQVSERDSSIADAGLAERRFDPVADAGQKSGSRFVKAITSAANSVLYVAVIDETIQIFSGRGSMVSDVCLDFCGGVFGALVCAGIVRTFTRSGGD